MTTVLVTGGSGFIGSHTMLQLLAQGHDVRTTVRNLNRESEVRALLKRGGAEPGDRLKFSAAPLRAPPNTIIKKGKLSPYPWYKEYPRVMHGERGV